MKPLTRQRLIIVGVFALFMAPILVALGLNMPGVNWTPFGLRNNGDLLQPPPSLSAIALRAVDGGSLDTQPFADTWTMLVPARAPCDSRCESALDKAQRARLALGEHGGRTRLLWMVTGKQPPAADEIERLQQRYPAARVAVHVGGELPPALGDGSPTSGAFVVDPRAYLILRYDEGFEGRGLLKDMERLLKYTEDG